VHPEHAPLQSVTLLLGSPFSGSSLLGQSLNDIAGIAYAGELDRLHRFNFALHRAAEHHRSICDICKTHEPYDCPVFQDPDEPLAADDAFPVEEYLQVLRRFDVPFVIDGSKNVAWLWHLHGKGLLDVLPTKALLTTRSVWGFVASALRDGRSDPYRAAEGWRNIYRHALRTTAKLMVPTLTVRHEDFLADQDKWLSRAAWFVSDQPHNVYEPKALHATGGNTSAHLIRPEYDRAAQLRRVSGALRERDEAKIAYFGGVGHEPRGNPLERWIRDIQPHEAYGILALPGVMDTMLDLGYDPLHMLDQYNTARAQAA